MSKYLIGEYLEDNEYIEIKKSKRSINESSRNIILSPNEELEKLEHIFEGMERDIKSLWNNVMLPYINNYNNKQILTKLSSDDYDKFYNYMVNNNEMIQYVLCRISELQK